MRLLLPAAAFFVGAGAMQPGGEHNVDIFGAIWFVSMAGVGIALWRGARLDT